MDVPAQEERVNSPFLCLFVLFGPSKDWMTMMMPVHIGEGRALHSVS